MLKVATFRRTSTDNISQSKSIEIKRIFIKVG